MISGGGATGGVLGGAARAAAAVSAPVAALIGGIGAALYPGTAGIDNEQELLDLQNAMQNQNANDDITSGTRSLGDLEPIHDPGHRENDPKIGKLSDKDLKDALVRPANGAKVTVKGNGNRVWDGNTRVNEAKKRGFPDDMQIPVDQLPDIKYDH
ncbi:hypothetical protein [Hydrocarboniphaga sp.]|uniref:hypothetical protein n=1 Tax=Hydrocarboniphaga sp. TaxID=2033016 RepID=UPI0026363D83|nr:hypothetical protein [Hydrocarboniphaga sp.]